MADYYPPGEQCPHLMAQAKNRDSKWTWLPADVRTSYITITLASRQTRVESKTSVAGRPGSSFGLVSLEPSREPFHLNRNFIFLVHVHRFRIVIFQLRGRREINVGWRYSSGMERRKSDSVPTTINIQLVPSWDEHRVPRTTVSRNVAFEDGNASLLAIASLVNGDFVDKRFNAILSSFLSSFFSDFFWYERFFLLFLLLSLLRFEKL